MIFFALRYFSRMGRNIKVNVLTSASLRPRYQTVSIQERLKLYKRLVIGYSTLLIPRDPLFQLQCALRHNVCPSDFLTTE